MTLNFNPPHLLFVVGNYYPHIADELVAGATQAIEDVRGSFDVVKVPGVFEIPAVIAHADRSSHRPTGKSYDGYVALGCVIRGETSHYDYVCSESARALMDLSVEGLPIGYGILTVENESQALVRAKRDQKNKGKDAVEACLTLLATKRRLNLGGV
ncbi:6,7-dimethyl-8-ribityllumazine synthase [Candidatus Phycosocius spiralis]|uniref:6,7-dimethyl-8-ribityllumazine synthase n=1 Tax=Candidatus Phycosocius spiralis TaxID=2815099 RepID=A0ABQ4PSB6_9PROT|nr:6,7-dimethyl-8-ribityllumazine synthase [Candidatus Phycosocius spiralis]GIU65895.1 6,7-dimethyl-8-ribityllumazine synthase [Candidatus Phycosocius spiralis]